MTAMRLRRFAQSANRKIVCFCPARKKNDLVWSRANERCDLAPRAIHGRTSLLTEEVHARGVAKPLSQVRHHRLNHARVNRRGRAVIQVDSAKSGHRKTSGAPTSEAISRI